MKKSSIAAMLMLGCVALPAHATILGFTGPFAPATWTTIVTGNLTGAAGGSAAISATALTLVGGNAISPDPNNFVPACTGASVGVPGNCQISFTTGTIAAPFVFDWAYSSADSAGANDDLFGMLIDGVRVQLSDPGGAINQTGHVSISANSSFGWYVNCTDCIEGAATATITNFAAGRAVPEPETMALIGFGVAATALSRRTRRGRPGVAGALAAC